MIICIECEPMWIIFSYEIGNFLFNSLEMMETSQVKQINKVFFHL